MHHLGLVLLSHSCREILENPSHWYGSFQSLFSFHRKLPTDPNIQPHSRCICASLAIMAEDRRPHNSEQDMLDNLLCFFFPFFVLALIPTIHQQAWQTSGSKGVHRSISATAFGIVGFCFFICRPEGCARASGMKLKQGQEVFGV